MKYDNLQTPKWVYSRLGKIDLDPCAGENTKIADVNLWDGRGEDGLSYKWNGFVFCNPPFSQKRVWAKKMMDHGNGILLLPERGSAPWFGTISKHSEHHFVMGKKIDFVNGPSSNNLGSVLFLFGKDAILRIIHSGLPGHINKTIFFNPRNSEQQSITEFFE